MTPSTIDHWILAKHRLRDDTAGALLLWAGLVVFVLILVFAISAFRTIEVSGWETASQLPRWFAGAIGVYLTAVYLPLYVAHGFTRREIARQLPVAAIGTVVIMAVCMTLGYGIERVVYTVAGWPQALGQEHLYTTASDYSLIFLEFLLLFTVWASAGALAGAAVYRNPAYGFVAIPVAVVLVGLAEAAVSPGFFTLVTVVTGLLGFLPDTTSITTAVVVTGGCVAIALPATWVVIRDLPLRNERT